MTAATAMAVTMVIACGLVALVAYLLARAPQDERVSDQWRNTYIRDRRDDV